MVNQLLDFKPVLVILLFWAPLFGLSQLPRILQWFTGWWGWFAGTILGVGLLLALVCLAMGIWRDECDPARDTETACEIGSLTYPVMFAWYLLVAMFQVPRIVKTIKAKFQTQVV
jgi:hypothetical protein